MDRLISVNSVPLAGADVAPVTGTPQYATSGNPVTGQPATVWPAYQANAITEEIVRAILASGQTLDRTNLAQLSAALTRFAGGQGECRLTLSGANLLLSPYNGNIISINGVPQQIPAAGVTLGAGGLQAPVNISTVAITSNVLTVVTSTAHGRVSGDSVWVNSSNLGMINGTATLVNPTTFTVPFTHANLGSTGDTGTTGALYYVYDFMSAGTMTLEAVPIPYVISATTGMPVKSTDATRTLVGLATTAAGPVFSPVPGIASWFNPLPQTGTGNFSTTRSTTSNTIIEVNSEIRVNFVSFANRDVQFNINGEGTFTSSGTASFMMAFNIDGVTQNDATQNSGINQISWSINARRQSLAEGFHFVSLNCAVGASATAQFFAPPVTASQAPTLLTATIQG